MKDFVFAWEAAGFFFIVIFGCLLHFAFDWLNRLPIIGIFSPVNESVWEHLKLGFWSVVIFAFIEYPFLKSFANNFIIAKAAGILVLQLFIIGFFYTYTAILGTHLLFLDILSYVIGALLCQVISYHLLLAPAQSHSLNMLSAAFLLLHALILVLFTFYPPKLPIFQDGNTKSYGISSAKAESVGPNFPPACWLERTK
ncbi:MAG: hypothetical protein KGZ75_12825 [Syntrophomonadaceae bacterium]|jgi:hypothetical protein|nr:hypothetical protein [Syntrophomonadaceae bacterium]